MTNDQLKKEILRLLRANKNIKFLEEGPYVKVLDREGEIGISFSDKYKIPFWRHLISRIAASKNENYNPAGKIYIAPADRLHESILKGIRRHSSPVDKDKSSKQEFKDFMEDLAQMSPEEKDVFRNLVILHEIDEGITMKKILDKKINDPFPFFSHTSPRIILSEHDRLSGTAEEYELANAMSRALRVSTGEEEILRQSQVSLAQRRRDQQCQHM